MFALTMILQIAFSGCIVKANNTCVGSLDCPLTDTALVWASDSTSASAYTVSFGGGTYWLSGPITVVPKSCLDLVGGSSDTSWQAIVETAAKETINSVVFWELFTIGFGGVLLLSVPRWSYQSIHRMMTVFDRDEHV